MIRVLIDANVILDVLFARSPHARASEAVWKGIENGSAEGLIAGHAVTTVYYLIRKQRGASEAKRVVAEILRVFQIAPVNEQVLTEALALPSTDFEDCVTIMSAHRAKCDLIVTRDPAGFRGSPIRVLSPEAAAPVIAVRNQ